MGILETRHVEPAVALHHVESVERGGGHIDNHVSRSRLGVGHINVLQNFGSARFVVQHCFHCSSSVSVRGLIGPAVSRLCRRG